MRSDRTRIDGSLCARAAVVAISITGCIAIVKATAKIGALRCAGVDETQHYGEKHCERRTHPNGAAPNHSICGAQQQGLIVRPRRARARAQGARRAPQFPDGRCQGKGAEGSPATHAPGSGAEARRLGFADLGGTRLQTTEPSPNAVGRGSQNWRETSEVYFRLQRKFGLIADSLCDATRRRSNFVKSFFEIRLRC